MSTSAPSYPSNHLVHTTAIKPAAMIIETRATAMFCQKLKFPAKKAKNNMKNAIQQTPMIIVPEILEPSEFMKLILLERSNIAFATTANQLAHASSRVGR